MAHIVECEDCGEEFDLTIIGYEVETERGVVVLCEGCYQHRQRHSGVLDRWSQDHEEE